MVTQSMWTTASPAARKKPYRQQPLQTPAQRKKRAEDSISQIKSIMNNEQSEGDDGTQEDWKKMLKLLEESRDEIDKEPAKEAKKAPDRVETKSRKKTE